MQTGTSHFDTSAASWDTPEKVKGAQKNALAVQNALKQIDPNFKVHALLEIGCGTGLLGQQLLDVDTPYYGIDASSEMLKVLKQKMPAPHIHALNLDIESSELPLFDYNLMISQMAFHHLKEPAQVLKKLNLVPGRYFAIIDLDKEDGSFHHDPKAQGVHHSGFSRSEIENWAQNSGLTLSHYEILGTKQKNGKEYPLFLALLSSL